MFRKTLKYLGFALLAVAVFSLFYVRRHYMAPVLMYHHIVPDNVVPENKLSVRVGTFEKQMGYLKRRNYKVIPIKDLALMIKNKQRIPRNVAAITFDDGYDDNYTLAFPVLKKFSFPASIYLITTEIGMPGRLDVSQIQEMRDSGLISFGSHSISHPLLTESNDQRALVEIAGSKAVLERGLGIDAQGFCYPGGRFDQRCVEDVHQAGYIYALASDPGSKWPDDNAYLIKRVKISDTNMFVFAVQVSGYYNFMRERRHR